MTDTEKTGLSSEELAAEGATPLPDKEVVSLLDLNADLDLNLDAAAPIDLAVAANANVAAPIDAAVAANLLSPGSEAQALADQDALISQSIEGDAAANAGQDSVINQGETAEEEPASGIGDIGETVEEGSGALDGDLLNVDVDLAADADIAAPINGAVAANANVAAPIDAAVAANVGSVDSEATAVAQQDVLISQNIEGDAEANSEQDSEINQ